ncbi:MAG: xanthine dehydrogenase family protein molybdopterin-binding subunit, partial [Burkholderiaceae bacterium]
MSAPALQVVGHSAPRKDALEKVTGRAQYTTDIVLPGMLHAKVLRSARAHARIVSIDVDAARQAPGVHRVVTGADIPQHVMPFYGYFIKDQPIVALDKVRYVGDIVCAVAADTEAAAIAALRLVRVTYE